MARELAVSRTVVSEAYEILVAEGYLDTRRGSGTYVAGDELAGRPREPVPRAGRRPRWLRRKIDAPAIDPAHDPPGMVSMRICEPEPTSFPDPAWRTCARAAIAERLPDGYAPAPGDEELRQAIAAWVTRERGLRCTAEAVVVTSGTTQSLDLLARATLAVGDTVAFEDPGYRLARQIFTDCGATIRPVPVDDEGLDVRQLDGSRPPLLVYTTPSHQFPLGGVLSYRRRAQLLDWAVHHDALVVEDDYDSELRFDGPALPALAAHDDRGSVVYLGTFSKVLMPSLRLGYMIAPRPLRDAVVHLKVRADHGSGWLTQRALARYMTSGAFARHLRRMRRLYRDRRDRLFAALAPLPAGAEWVGLAAGLHATLRLPGNLARRTVQACHKRGILVRALSEYACGPIPFDGLVLGYGACPNEQLESTAAVVRKALEGKTTTVETPGL